MGDSIDLNHFRHRLEDERTRLQATASERESASKTVELDQQKVGRLSRMDALQMQAMARAEAGRAIAQLGRIAAALQRLERGSFGYCRDCDQAIALGRLEADPAALLCIGCAERAD